MKPEAINRRGNQRRIADSELAEQRAALAESHQFVVDALQELRRWNIALAAANEHLLDARRNLDAALKLARLASRSRQAAPATRAVELEQRESEPAASKNV